MASKSKTKIDFGPVKNKIKKMRGKLKNEDIGQRIVDDLVEGIRVKAINWETGKPFDSLTSNTIKSRKYLAKYNPTHTSYLLKKQNLTITGKFLDSIKAEIEKTKQSIVWTIDVSGKHDGYKTGKGRGPSIPNKRLRTYLSQIDRDPLGLSEKVKAAIHKVFYEYVKKGFKQ